MFDLRKKVPETATLDQTSVEALEACGRLSFFQYSDPKIGWNGKIELNVKNGQWNTFLVEAGGWNDKQRSFPECVATLLDRVREVVDI